jgi:hypothetical protein
LVQGLTAPGRAPIPTSKRSVTALGNTAAAISALGRPSGHAGHPGKLLITLDCMRVAMRQLPRIHAGQIRKIVPDMNKQIQWPTRMPRMPRIIHRVRLARLGLAQPRHAAIADRRRGGAPGPDGSRVRRCRASYGAIMGRFSRRGDKGIRPVSASYGMGICVRTPENGMASSRRHGRPTCASPASLPGCAQAEQLDAVQRWYRILSDTAGN